MEIDLFVDVGSNKDPANTEKASTVGSLIGYTRNCERIIVLETWVVSATSHDDIIKQFEQKIEWWWAKYLEKFKKIVIDNADSILVSTWRTRNKYRTITVKGCVKAYQKIITLVTRCTLKQQLILQDRLLWSTHAYNNYLAHTRILLEEDGSEKDLSVQDNDIGDTVAYGLTEKWVEITRNNARG